MPRPTVVTDELGAEILFDGVSRLRMEWARLREVAIGVVVAEELRYWEAFWHLTGERTNFVVSVERAVGSKEFKAALFALPGFDHDTYRQARAAEAACESGTFVCWRARP